MTTKFVIFSKAPTVDHNFDIDFVHCSELEGDSCPKDNRVVMATRFGGSTGGLWGIGQANVGVTARRPGAKFGGK